MIEEHNVSIDSEPQQVLELRQKQYGYKELMVGTISNLKNFNTGNFIPLSQHADQQHQQSDKNTHVHLNQIVHHEYIQTFSFQNDLYIASVSGNHIRIVRQRFVKILNNERVMDYSEFTFRTAYPILNQVIFIGIDSHSAVGGGGAGVGAAGIGISGSLQSQMSSRFDNQVILLIPCVNGSICIRQLSHWDYALKCETLLEAHGQPVYSIGETYKNQTTGKVQIIANLPNAKVYLYDFDVFALDSTAGNAQSNSFSAQSVVRLPMLKHSGEVKMFSNILTMLYESKIKQSTQNSLLAGFTPLLAPFLLTAISKDLKLKILSVKNSNIVAEIPILQGAAGSTAATAVTGHSKSNAHVDHFKNTKIAVLLDNPFLKKSRAGAAGTAQLDSSSQQLQSNLNNNNNNSQQNGVFVAEDVQPDENVHALIAVGIVKHALNSKVVFFDVELGSEESEGNNNNNNNSSYNHLVGSFATGEEALRWNNSPLAFAKDVQVKKIREVFTWDSRDEIVDFTLSAEGMFVAFAASGSIAQVESQLSFIPFDQLQSFGPTSSPASAAAATTSASSLSILNSADFSLKHALQQDLAYLDSNDSQLAFKEQPVNRLLMPDRFPLKDMHGFFSRSTSEFQLKPNFLGTGDLRQIGEYLLAQTEMKFEAAIKNSLLNLTTTWINKYPVLALHTIDVNVNAKRNNNDTQQQQQLPIVVRESGLFNLVPIDFFECMNYSLNAFMAEFKQYRQQQQQLQQHLGLSQVPSSQYQSENENRVFEEDFALSSVFEKHVSKWRSGLGIELMPQIFECLTWSKLHLVPDVINALNQCPFEKSFEQCVLQGLQIASNTLSYASLCDVFSSCDDQMKLMTQLGFLLTSMLQSVLNNDAKGCGGSSGPAGIARNPLVLNVSFGVWSRNLISGDVRTRLREVAELSLTILSFFKYIEYRHSSDRLLSCLPSDSLVSVETLYGITFLFDKPLVYLSSLNRLSMKEEEQSLDHMLYLDVMQFVSHSQISLSIDMPRNLILAQNSRFLEFNVNRILQNLFENLNRNSSSANAKSIPNVLQFLNGSGQHDVSLCVANLIRPQTASVLFSQAISQYALGNTRKVVSLLQKILAMIHVNPRILEDGPWRKDRNLLANHQELKDQSISEDVKFLRYCVNHFLKESEEDLKAKYELSQIALLLVEAQEAKSVDVFRKNSLPKCKAEFNRHCFIFAIHQQDHHLAFNYIKAINALVKKESSLKVIVNEIIAKFVESLCKHECIGIVSQLGYEDDLSDQVCKHPCIHMKWEC